MDENKKETFEMIPDEASETSTTIEGIGFTMTPSESTDAADDLAKDFGKIDEAPIKDAMNARDNALRESVTVATGGEVPETTDINVSAAPEINASTTVVGGPHSENARSTAASGPEIPVRDSSVLNGRTGGNHYAQTSARAGKKKEKKYVTRGALIASLVFTMLLSTLMGSLLGAGLAGNGRNYNDNRTERDDSQLSQLNLSDATGSEMTVSEIVRKNADAVVEIVVSGTTQGLWGQLQLAEGAGSGIIIREDGYIATNYHVIQGANKVEVTLHNGDVYTARIVGSDAANDIAVIKIEESNLTTATIGDSSKVEVGDLAVAIGNPLGQLGGTATTGIISALDRTLSVEGTTLTLLQTDAAINGGNSGGGLFNSKGELIGIVESKASAVGVEGLAFALPINSVSEIINNIIETGGNVNGQIAGTPAVGIVISDVSEDQSEYYGLDEPGVYVAKVTGINAQQAGFHEQDRIVSFNATKVSNSSEFIALVRKCKVGDTVSVIVSRQGQEIEIKTVLEELQTNQ